MGQRVLITREGPHWGQDIGPSGASSCTLESVVRFSSSCLELENLFLDGLHRVLLANLAFADVAFAISHCVRTAASP